MSLPITLLSYSYHYDMGSNALHASIGVIDPLSGVSAPLLDMRQSCIVRCRVRQAGPLIKLEKWAPLSAIEYI